MSKSPFGFERPKDSPGFLLWQSTALWQRKIKKVLEPFGVSHAQFVIMAALYWLEDHGEDTTQTTIVRLTKLDKMTISKSLKKLAAESLVKRIEHAVDTRAKSVSLTTKGRSLVRQMVPAVEAVDTEFFGGISKKDEKNLLHLFDRLITHEEGKLS